MRYKKFDWGYLCLNCDNDPSIIFDFIYDKVIKVLMHQWKKNPKKKQSLIQSPG